MMELKGLYCFVSFFFTINLCGASRLNHLNRTPLKSIQTKDGYVIDCMHVSRQPAFDHPLLKSHAIQMGPSNHPEEVENKPSNFKSTVAKSITQSWQLDGRCPEGTIPIRRTLKQEEPSLPNSIKSFGKNYEIRSLQATSTDTDVKESITPQYAFVLVGGVPYYGAKAIMNIWEPHVQPNDTSTSNMWIAAGSSVSDLNAIFVGWHVAPEIYGDNKTRFFLAWTRDGFQSTGCLNLRCPGFVQISNEIALGTPFPLVSTINGAQFEFSILIFKGQNAWWLQYNNITLGYWPLSLFTNLANNASAVGWGGSVINSHSDGQQSTTTQMGSGHFPEEGFGRASYMRQLHVLDETLTLKVLDSPRILVQQPNCYNITVGNNDAWEDFIFYGGPGRNPKCP